MMWIEPRTSRSNTSTTKGSLDLHRRSLAIGDDCVFGSPHSEPPLEGCGAEAGAVIACFPNCPEKSLTLSVRVSRSAPQRPLGSPRVVPVVMARSGLWG